ncbi:MAG: hypothetical protein ACP5NV_03695 [Candidatus Woesearchaeota archaeon]
MIKTIADPDKYFYTVDKRTITNLYQLLDYVSYCSDANYASHVTGARNDFANWIEYVLGIIDLAEKLRSSQDRVKNVEILKDFVDKINSGQIVQNEVQNEKTIGPGINSNGGQVVQSNSAVQDSPYNASNNSEKSPFDKGSKDSITKDSTPKDSTTGKFHEFTDEELEKFSKFGKKDPEAEDEKVAFLKFELNELRNTIKELRKNEKDPLIPDLLLRSLDSKIAYYAISKKQEDYDHIVSTFNDVKREIDYCNQEVPYSFTDEIIQGLELQKVILKKM